MYRSAIPLLVSIILACGAQSLNNTNSETSTKPSESFSDYWYSGKAELNHFELSQMRYGEMRKAESILVFVSEDFLTEKQVKKERPSKQKASSVLKLNELVKFTTGIYDYALMTSVFTPIQGGHPMKITSSSQEWCGQTFMQLNHRKEKFHIQRNSYFEQEADRDFTLDEVRTEDGLWNQIRLNPNAIEVGEFMYLPSSQYLQLNHKKIQAYQAQLSKQEYAKDDMPGDKLWSIELRYPDLDRRLEIIYEGDFPHRIAGWKEFSAIQSKKPQLQAMARRAELIREPYWNLNRNADSTYRKQLGLKE